MLSSSYIILRIQRLEVKSIALDEVVHYEPPHQDLRYLQIQLFPSLVFRVRGLNLSRYLLHVYLLVLLMAYEVVLLMAYEVQALKKETKIIISYWDKETKY